MEETWGANQPTERGHAAKNPAYNRVNLKVNRLSHRIAGETDQEKRATMLQHLHTLQEERKRTASRKPAKRLTCIRYADDWVILLYEYSKDEARAMKATIAEWLKTTLKLTLSTEKTLITHWTDRVTFLGFEPTRGSSLTTTAPDVPPGSSFLMIQRNESNTQWRN